MPPDYDGPTWFSEATEDQVRLLLDNLEDTPEVLVSILYHWAMENYQWYAGNHVLVNLAREETEKTRAERSLS